MRNNRFPKYPDDADYNTNSPSYYDDLARKQKLIELLAKKIWEYEETLDLTLDQISNRLESYIVENDNLMIDRLEQWDLNLENLPENVELLLEEWLSDGTLDHIINETIFNWKADTTYVDSEIQRLEQKDKDITTQMAQLPTKEETIETALDKPARVYLGVIRNNGDGWDYIEDSVHEKLNFTGLTINENDEIQVNMKAGTKVGSLIAVPDETFAGLGVVSGTSVGVYNSSIRLYAEFSGKIDGDGVINTKDWFDGTYSVEKSTDNSQVTLTFDGVDDINLPFSIVPEYEGSPPFDGLEIRAYRVTTKSVIFRAFKDLYGLISYSGSNWTVGSSCVANIQASFTDGELTITHDGMTGTGGHMAFNSVNVDMRATNSDTLMHARVVSATAASIKVKFYDHDGNLITTPNSNMRIYFTRPGFKVPHEWPKLARAYFNIGLTKLRPEKVVSSTGNIWLIGINHT